MKEETSIKNTLRNKFDELPVNGTVNQDWHAMKKALRVAMPTAALGIAIQWKALLTKKIMWLLVASITAIGGATELIVYMRHQDNEKQRVLPVKVAPVAHVQPVKTNTQEKQPNTKQSNGQHGLLADSTAKQNDATVAVPDTIVQHKKQPIKIGKTIRQSADTTKSTSKHKVIVNHQNNVPPKIKKKIERIDDTLAKAKNKPDSVALQGRLKKHPRQPPMGPDSVARKHKKLPLVP